VNPWKDKTIKINDSWGPGANEVLHVPLGCAPEFSMRERYLRDNKGANQLGQLSAAISSGYLSDGWQSATFTPVGTIGVTGISGLPPWDPSQAQVYRDMIQSPNNNLGDSRTLRLEGSSLTLMPMALWDTTPCGCSMLSTPSKARSRTS